MTAMAVPELFWNEFDRWLEANGITFGRPLLPARRTYPATVDLGALKAGILELLDLDAGPPDEEDPTCSRCTFEDGTPRPETYTEDEGCTCCQVRSAADVLFTECPRCGHLPRSHTGLPLGGEP